MKKMLLLIFSIVLLSIIGCSEKEVLPVEISFKGENSVDMVVLVDEPNYAISEMASAFAEKLAVLTGKIVEVAEKSEYKGSCYTVYVDTVSEDHANTPDYSVYANPKEVDVFTWIESLVETYEKNSEIVFGETSAQVIAPDEYSLYFALDEFIAYIETGSATVEAGTRKLLPVSDIISPAELISRVGDVRFLFTEHKVTFVYTKAEAEIPGNVLAVTDDQDGMQGGGTDGKYAYYALYSDDEAYIYKFDLATWKLVDVSELLPTGHSNDITYVPEENVLLVADCTTKDDWKGVHYIDPDTLEYLRYDILPAGCRGLQYIPETKQYVVTGGYVHNVYDKDFNYIKSINCGFPKDTTQGLCCDGSYIYDSRWGDKDAEDHSGQNRLLIHDMEGNFISEGIICGDPYRDSSENENVFIHNNLFYVGHYNDPRTVNEYVMLPVSMFE